MYYTFNMHKYVQLQKPVKDNVTSHTLAIVTAIIFNVLQT